jgi:hypothetical protein
MSQWRVCDHVGLIQNDQIPNDGCHAPERFGSLDEIDRSNSDFVEQPRIGAGWQQRAPAAQQKRVDNRGGNAKSGVELLLPLLAKSRGCEKKRPFCETTLAKLGEKQSGLNRFAQTHLIRQEDATGQSPTKSERRFQLKRQELNSSECSGAQSIEWVVQRQELFEPATPFRLSHDSQRGRNVFWLQAVERIDQGGGLAGVLSPNTGQMDDGARIERVHVVDLPDCSAHPHASARRQQVVQFLRCVAGL